MLKINDIAKETLLLLKERGLKATPENYSEVFEELSLKAGLSTGLKEKIQKYQNLLIPYYQDKLKSRSIRNIEEFISFLISNLNQKNSTKADEFFELLHNIMQNLLASKDKKVKELASFTLANISKTMEIKHIFLLSKKWIEFAQNYNDADLDERLKSFGIRNDEFVSTIKKLLKELEQRSYERFARLIALCLPPSLAKSDKIENFSTKIKEKPYLLSKKDENDEFELELFNIVNTRINVDNIYTQQHLSFFNQNLQSLNKILDDIDLINKSNKDFVKSLKQDDKGNVSISFDELKSKFLDLNDRLLETVSSKVKNMSDEKQREAWTLKSQILRLDELFLKEKINYALCVFSVSNYKYIMQKYGVGNLNEILVRFKKILKDNCKDEDELWILDEKSYLVVLSNTSYEDVISFMQTCSTAIENFKFIYKQDVVKPFTVSFFMDKASFPHINLLDEILKKLREDA